MAGTVTMRGNSVSMLGSMPPGCSSSRQGFGARSEGPSARMHHSKLSATWSDRNVASLSVGTALALAMQLPQAQGFGPVRMALDNLRVETVTCPSGTRAFGGYDETRCLVVTAHAQNDSGKLLYNVDVFGRVYDADGNNALDRDDASDAGRVTNIPKVKPGEQEVRFPLRVSEQQAQRGDLQFKSFKAVGYPGAAFTPLLDECTDELGELQLGGECAEEESEWLGAVCHWIVTSMLKGSLTSDGAGLTQPV
eukprot:CAMPEP_0117673650 /NCGR_PEP_ID=MMETSP0804-20121206/14589_1 /TAXON_ID=1074897 /ORGANISM="Tetraselmis astigmatica, Strain CCMP880" /LENGTH=250 /DNA_ID=CAMNT_0005482409 /DNA_START=34 /DNA_END=787 /DNA_ORIENTATION=-